MFACHNAVCDAFQKLAESEDDSFMGSEWADSGALKKQFQGLNNIKWGPGKGF